MGYSIPKTIIKGNGYTFKCVKLDSPTSDKGSTLKGEKLLPSVGKIYTKKKEFAPDLKRGIL